MHPMRGVAAATIVWFALIYTVIAGGAYLFAMHTAPAQSEDNPVRVQRRGRYLKSCCSRARDEDSRRYSGQ
ncbi:MAG: hypothetical protein V7640_3274 [Betaproteobacteria bacterium]